MIYSISVTRKILSTGMPADNQLYKDSLICSLGHGGDASSGALGTTRQEPPASKLYVLMTELEKL